MTRAPRLTTLVAVVATAAVLALLPVDVTPAGAHGSDPNVISVLDVVDPLPPPPVQVSVVMGVAAEVVVSNPTTTPLEAIDADGRAFLRISADGVEADVSSPAFVESSAPAGRAAATPATAQPRFVRLSPVPTWSWFDHRLHPPGLRVPAEAVAADGPSRLAEWTVPLRYGATAITLRGHVEYRRQRGRIMTSLEPTGLPGAIQVSAVDGRLPGLFVRNPTAEVLRVLDPDGATYVEIGPDGVRVNPASSVHLADRRARGEAVQPPPTAGAPPVRLSAAPAYTWLDPRLRPPASIPDDVQRRRTATELVAWRVPYRLGARTGELRGTTSFVPFATRPGDAVKGTGRRPLAIGLAGAALLAVAAVVVSRRRVRGAGRDDGARRASYDDRRSL